ncbi:MAG: hypothetical protein B193_0412 [Solidesulfovibrio magneticus str. Maddingley MBC34]|uniref:HTH arsR-type domain-containing protein n=1 Tax=Solidesulfovibrio magneticus str. Maddingley MBC34 TaxID=1206767 RepID=K6FQM5_9BACT|nr:MAG: hypothetical protein B193_0412 [Solidesulfovibrio magneticus str. Maddingley MBC34]
MDKLTEGVKVLADSIRLRLRNLLRLGELRARDLTACLE